MHSQWPGQTPKISLWKYNIWKAKILVVEECKWLNMPLISEIAEYCSHQWLLFVSSTGSSVAFVAGFEHYILPLPLPISCFSQWPLQSTEQQHDFRKKDQKDGNILFFFQRFPARSKSDKTERYMEITFQTGTSSITSSFSCPWKSSQKDPESQIGFCEPNMIN